MTPLYIKSVKELTMHNITIVVGDSSRPDWEVVITLAPEQLCALWNNLEAK